MTKDEIKKMILYFRTVYSGFCEDSNLTDVLNVWFDAFKDEDSRVVGTAAKNYVRSNRYPPTIAGVFEQIKLIKSQDTNTDLWAMIVKAAGNGTYHSVEEFEKLPEECKSFIGSPAALKDIAQADMGTLNTVVKGQFLKHVDSIKEHQEVQKGLPANVRQAIAESKMKLLQEGE